MNQGSAKSQGSDFKLLKTNNRTQSTGERVSLNPNCQCVRAFQQEPQQQNYSCQNCEENLQKVTSLKKSMIVIEYQNAKLMQQIQKIKKQNANLKIKLSEKIQIKINSIQNGGLLTIKQDLQAELFQCKLLNQLLMVGQYTKLDNQIKDKLDEIFMDKLVLQEQLEQKTRIINNTALYPIYHYDSRIKNLRNAVLYFYKIATKECKKTQQLIKLMKKETETIKGKLKSQIQAALSHQFQSYHEEKTSKTMTPLNEMKQKIKSMASTKIEYTKSSTQDKSKLFKQQNQDKEKVKKTEKQPKSKSKGQKKNKKNKEEVSTEVKDFQKKQEKFNRPCCIKTNE